MFRMTGHEFILTVKYLIKVGPGSYNVSDSKISKSNNLYSNQLWKRKFDLERAKEIPHFSIKEKKAQEKEQVDRIGPGFYKIDSALDYITRPYSTLKTGMMHSKAPKFIELRKDCHPGPGTYGIPQDKIDLSRDKIYLKTLGILDRGGSSSRLPEPQSFHLGPGIYNYSSHIDEVINHKTGTRGIYDCNSIDRSQPAITGHRANNVSYNLGPGQYQFGTETDRLMDKYNISKGKFLREVQYPKKPYQLVYWSEAGNVPPDPDNQVSPASYTVSASVKPKFHHQIKGGFNSTDERMNKIAKANFFGESNAEAGPGRYNHNYKEIGSSGVSAKWAFNSRVPQISNERMSHVSKSRVRTINIPNKWKKRIDHHSKEESVRVDLNAVNEATSSRLILA